MDVEHGQGDAHDEGMTLVELIVYAFLLIIVLGIVGTIFVNSMKTQAAVSSVTDALDNSQQVARSVQNGIRNSTAFKLVANGSDQLLIARTLSNGAAATPACVAWYYSATTPGSVRYTKLTSVLTAPPTAAVVATWTLLDSGVSPISGTTIFTRSSATDAALALAFKGTAGSNRPVQISTSIVSRANGTDVSSCYTGS